MCPEDLGIETEVIEATVSPLLNESALKILSVPVPTRDTDVHSSDTESNKRLTTKFLESSLHHTDDLGKKSRTAGRKSSKLSNKKGSVGGGMRGLILSAVTRNNDY